MGQPTVEQFWDGLQKGIIKINVSQKKDDKGELILDDDLQPIDTSTYSVPQYDFSGLTPVQIEDAILDVPKRVNIKDRITSNDATIEAAKNDLSMLEKRGEILKEIDSLYDTMKP